MDDPSWTDNLPDALKEAPYFKPLEDGTQRSVDQVLADLQNAANLQGNIGDTHIRVPNSDASDEDWGKFRERVLDIDKQIVTKPDDYSPVPEGPDGYKLPEIEGLSLDEDALASVKELAHSANWNQAQYDRYVESLHANQSRTAQAQQEWLDGNRAKLDEALGAARQERLDRAAGVLQDVLPEALVAQLKEGSLDAAMTLAVDSLVQKIVDMGTEEEQFTRQHGGQSGALTPDEAQSKADEIFMQLRQMTPGSRDYNRLIQKRMDYIALARR